MASLTDVIQLLQNMLKPALFTDYCPNGLQVAGREEIGLLVTGVTASQALIDAAIALSADAILVHHGWFWKGESPCIVGLKHKRLKALLLNDISMLAYHLPLDAHPVLGNNAQMAARLGWEIEGLLYPDNPKQVGNVARLPEPLSPQAFAQRLQDVLGQAPLHIEGGPAEIRRVGFCTGAAQGFIDQAISMGCDAYVSGEISEPTVHSAREAGIHYFAAGHHATERYGVQAVGDFLAMELGLKHVFVDVANPV